MDHDPGPVTADDVLTVAAASVAALRTGAHGDWSAPAGELTWDCWETVEHTADDLFSYAAHLGADLDGDYLPFEADVRHPGGPRNTIRSDPDAGPEGLFAVLTASATVLAAMVRVAAPTARAPHPHGRADPEASAAMGVLETLLHTEDVACGLGLRWNPDPDLCARVLARLLPEIERTDEPWTDLLWASGRIALPGRPRRESWGWDNRTPAERACSTV